MTRPVAFASWRCNCTILAATLEDVPAECPAHPGATLYARPEWTDTPMPLGVESAPDHVILCSTCHRQVEGCVCGCG